MRDGTCKNEKLLKVFVDNLWKVASLSDQTSSCAPDITNMGISAVSTLPERYPSVNNETAHSACTVS
jgi:hypothetical protein